MTLVPDESDLHDRHTAVLEIRAQGEEAVAFGVRLARMYLAFARSRGWKTRIIWPFPPRSEGDLLETIFLVAGLGAYAALKYESGIHLLHESGASRRGVAYRDMAMVWVLPEATREEVAWRDDDVRIDWFRHGDDPILGISSLDKVLRITHLPTGIQVFCHKPMWIGRDNPCMLALRARLLHGQRTDRENQTTVIRTYDLSTDQIIDTRLPAAITGASMILDGAPAPLLDALQAHNGGVPPDASSDP